MEIKEFILMEIGIAPNGFEITKEMVENALDSFTNCPIIYNKKAIFKDYRDNDTVENFNNDFIIGFIKGDIEILDNKLIGTVGFFDDLLERFELQINKNKYDNWQIIVENGNFTYRACEIFE